MKKLKFLKKFSKIKLPFWAVLLLMVNVSLVVGIVTNLYNNRQAAKVSQVVEAGSDDTYVQNLTAQVLPASGYTTQLKWGDLVKRLVETGAIDEAKYREIFKSPADGAAEMDLLTGDTGKFISINSNNSRFVVNTLWALGLTQKSQVLDEGPMQTSGSDPANFASTGGWTIGKKDAMQLYSSQELIKLSAEEQERVQQIAENVYRPCCGNSTAFPDCNHGMAALGYIELAVAAGLSEEQIYKDLLAFNSFWFPQTYVEMAVYFEKNQTLTWDKVDPKLALSQEYSSAQGAQKVTQAVQNVPGLRSKGGSCGA